MSRGERFAAQRPPFQDFHRQERATPPFIRVTRKQAYRHDSERTDYLGGRNGFDSTPDRSAVTHEILVFASCHQ